MFKTIYPLGLEELKALLEMQDYSQIDRIVYTFIKYATGSVCIAGKDYATHEDISYTVRVSNSPLSEHYAILENSVDQLKSIDLYTADHKRMTIDCVGRNITMYGWPLAIVQAVRDAEISIREITIH